MNELGFSCDVWSNIRKKDGWYSAYDLVEHIGGQANPHQTWDRIVNRHPDVLTNCENLKFKGRGQRKTPCLDTIGCFKLFAVLPGIAGAHYREKQAEIVVRHLQTQNAHSTIDRHNADRNRRIVARRALAESNKQLAAYAKNSIAAVHNARYNGDYGVDAQGMRINAARSGCPIEHKQSPMDFLQSDHLSLLNWQSKLYRESGSTDPEYMFQICKQDAQRYRQVTGKPLQPEWERSQLSATDAKKYLESGQTELPLLGS